MEKTNRLYEPGNRLTRVGLMGDIHSNLPALEAVLDALKENQVEFIANCGDFLGYNAFPEEVVSLCRHEEIPSVIGNYDVKVLKFPRKAKQWRKRKHPQKWFSFKWSYENLSDESRNYLRYLPERIELKFSGKELLIVHGSPESIHEHLFSTTPTRRFEELANTVTADIVVFGHSHEPFSKWVRGKLFINTGSVGRPDDGDPRATAAVLEIGGEISVRHLKIPYDVERAVSAIHRKKLPLNFARMIREGRALDWVLENS